MQEITLEPQDVELLLRPVVGKGGWQTLLRRLQKQIDGRTLRLDERDTATLLKYILSYGSGGWQDRLAVAVGAETSKKKRRRTPRRAPKP